MEGESGRRGYDWWKVDTYECGAVVRALRDPPSLYSLDWMRQDQICDMSYKYNAACHTNIMWFPHMNDAVEVAHTAIDSLLGRQATLNTESRDIRA